LDKIDWQAAYFKRLKERHMAKGWYNFGDPVEPGEYFIAFDPGYSNNGLVIYNEKDVEATMGVYSDKKGLEMYSVAYEADQELALELQERKRKKLLEEKIALVDQYGEDTFANTTVLVFDKKFTADGKVYTYAALKTNDQWYVTGERGLFGFKQGGWNELVLGLVGGEYPVSAEEVAIAAGDTPMLDAVRQPSYIDTYNLPSDAI
jgi:hypothetical protein